MKQPIVALGYALAVIPALAFAVFASMLPAVHAGSTLTWAWDWVPALGVRVTIGLDGLSLLFALLITGIGALVLVYAGHYFAPHGGDARFFLYLFLFMLSMLGLVLARDVISLFVFWEATSILSFLLVAYKYKDEAARRGATKALVITGGTGIALLAGLLMLAAEAGSTQFEVILAQADRLKSSALYPVFFGLIALGALAKSAQFPAHHWLPDAMSAPTPASAFLHSATMVKAGVYLLARLHPALGGTELWMGVLIGAGAITMLIGAFKGLFQHDLKGVLAYSTIGQLGVLIMLIGWGSPAAMKALAVGVLAHALYKGALFLIAGIIDHAAHTRDLRDLRLRGLRNTMPLTFASILLPALSMAGLPPLFGFMGKETLLAAFEPAGWMALLLVVLAGALTLAQAGMLVLDGFAKPGKNVDPHASHDPAIGLLIAPFVLGATSLLIAFDFLLSHGPIYQLVSAAAAVAYGKPVKVDLALFQGINLPLVLSASAIALGLILTWRRAELRSTFGAYALLQPTRLDVLYRGLMRALDGAAWLATRLQSGRLRSYLVLMMAAFGLLTIWLGAWRWPVINIVAFNEPLALPGLRILGLLLAVAASLASVIAKRDMVAVLALGASGLGIALLLALDPSPDVALVQIIVDVLTTVILAAALSRLPARLRDHAHEVERNESGAQRVRNLVIAGLAGVFMFMLVINALAGRPRQSIVTPFYEQNSKPLTGAADIVGAIVVDFRGFDTMIEIAVFGMAGAAVYSLLRHAARKHADEQADTQSTVAAKWRDIGGQMPSEMLQTLARLAMPAAIMIGFVHIIYGHDQPGDGFTAGVIIGAAIGLMVLTHGTAGARARLPWVRPAELIGSGWLLVMAGSLAPMLLGQPFFSPVDFGVLWQLPLPKNFSISTSFLFEIAICLSVVGGASWLITSFTEERP